MHMVSDFINMLCLINLWLAFEWHTHMLSLLWLRPFLHLITYTCVSQGSYVTVTITLQLTS